MFGLWSYNLNRIAPIVCLLGQRQLSSTVIVISTKPKIISLYGTHYNAINYHNEIKNHKHFNWKCSKGLCLIQDFKPMLSISAPSWIVCVSLICSSPFLLVCTFDVQIKNVDRPNRILTCAYIVGSCCLVFDVRGGRPSVDVKCTRCTGDALTISSA